MRGVEMNADNPVMRGVAVGACILGATVFFGYAVIAITIGVVQVNSTKMSAGIASTLKIAGVATATAAEAVPPIHFP